MRRISIIALALALLLCGCGSTPVQPVDTTAPPTPDAAAVSPGIIEDEPEVYDSARDFLSSLYEEYGSFYFSNNAAPDSLDWLAQQPQDQPVKFVVYGWPFFNFDKRLDKWNVPLQNHDRALMALSEVLGDEALTEYESIDALRKTLDDEELLKKLPEEYPEWVQKAEGWEDAINTYESEYLPLSEALAESQASATPKLWNTSAGERQPRHFLGRELIRSTTESTNFCETAWKSQPFGKKKRSSPLVFSFVPRCHGLCGSAK